MSLIPVSCATDKHWNFKLQCIIRMCHSWPVFEHFPGIFTIDKQCPPFLAIAKCCHQGYLLVVWQFLREVTLSQRDITRGKTYEAVSREDFSPTDSVLIEYFCASMNYKFLVQPAMSTYQPSASTSIHPFWEPKLGRNATRYSLLISID